MCGDSIPIVDSEDKPTTVRIEHWLARVVAGDESARNEVLRHAEERLRVMARRMFRSFHGLRGWVETDDMFIEALNRLNNALKKIPVTSARSFFALASYHMRLALRTMWQQRVRAGGQPTIPIPNGDVKDGRHPPNDIPANTGDDPSQLADWSEIHNWIDHLPQELKEVFDLIWYQGMSFGKAAQILGDSTYGVIMRWQKARLAFQSKFGKDHF